MDKEKILAERQELMNRLQDEFQNNLIPAMIQEKQNEEDEDEPVILNVLLDELGSGKEEAYMECCFRPLATEDDGVQYFTTVITFSDNLEKAYLPAVIESVSYINFEIPCGSFHVDKSHTFLCFRLTAPLPIALEGDALYEEMDIITGNAVAVADTYFDLLLDVSQGAATVEDVIEYLGG